MINFSDAQSLGATDKQFEQQYNYLVELLSKYLSTGKISNVSGSSFFDLKNGQFNFQKDANNYLKYDGTTFEIKGTLVVTGGTAAATFMSTPVPPYKVGDTWFTSTSANTGDLKKCITAKTATESYDSADWVVATKYDNTQTVIDGGVTTTGTLQVVQGGTVAAGVTGEDSGDTAVRFFAGSTFANRYTAPFRVLQNGKAYLFGAEVAGLITVGGTTYGNGKISIKDDTDTEVGYIDKTGIWTNTDVRAGKRFLLPNIVPANSTELTNYQTGIVGIMFDDSDTPGVIPNSFIQSLDLATILSSATPKPRLRICSKYQIILSADVEADINSPILKSNSMHVSRVYSSTSGAGIIAEALTAITGSAAHGSIMLNVVDTDYPSRYLTGIFHINGSSTHVYTVLSYDTLSVYAVNTSGTVAIAGGSGNYQFDCTYLGG